MRRIWYVGVAVALVALLLSGCSLFGGERGTKTTQPVPPPQSGSAADQTGGGEAPAGDAGSGGTGASGGGASGNTGAGSSGGAGSPAVTDPGATSGLQVAGNTAELSRALAEPSSVQYEILIAEADAGADKTGYLDRVVAQRPEWPEHRKLLLVLFPESNWDIRFAMGTGFLDQDFTVEEMLSLVRTHYLPRAREGDPAAGLAALVRQVNARMAE